MTRDEGVALIKQQLQGRTTLDNDIVTYMQLAQTTLEYGPTKPWFLVETTVTMATVANQTYVPIPTGFITEVDDGTMIYRPDDWPTSAEVELWKDEYDVLRKYFASWEEENPSSAAEPQAYALMGERFYIFPTPDAVYTLYPTFYKKDTVLDTNVENQWLKHVPLLLLGSAGQLIAPGPLRDGGAAGVFSQWIKTGLGILQQMETDRDMKNRKLAVGGPAW